MKYDILNSETFDYIDTTIELRLNLKTGVFTLVENGRTAGTYGTQEEAEEAFESACGLYAAAETFEY